MRENGVLLRGGAYFDALFQKVCISYASDLTRLSSRAAAMATRAKKPAAVEFNPTLAFSLAAFSNSKA